MDQSNKFLSELVAYRTYAKYLSSHNRRESFEETINRCMTQHLDVYPKLSKDIIHSFSQVHDLKVMPSMRSLQFGGEAILKNNVRSYNCSFTHIDDVRSFGETLFLLLSGTGVGFSVQKHIIGKLPQVTRPREEGRFLVQDSIQGWAQALDALMESYLLCRIRPLFDFSSVRAKGSYLVTTGAKAPGPEPLRQMLVQVEAKLTAAIGRKLRPLEVHDIVCIIADCVLSGGIRRAALISLFDKDDKEMLECKQGEWWIKHPYRARANNSAVLPRGKVSKQEFDYIYGECIKSNAGEPGFFWTNDEHLGTNPCFTGDTKLLTAEGFKTLKELSTLGDNLQLVNYKGAVVSGKVWSNGVKPIVKLKLTTGDSIRCTPDHKFMVDGLEIEAQHLKGKRLTPLIRHNQNNDDYVKFGYLQGDGSLTRLNSPQHGGLEVHIGLKDAEIASLFDIEYSSDVRSYYINGYNDVLRDLQFSPDTLPSRDLPKSFNNWTSKAKASFMKGLYSANGSVIKDARVSLKSTCQELIFQTKEYLESLGMEPYVTVNKAKPVQFNNGSYICKESYDLNLTRYGDLIKFSELIGFVHSYKTKALTELLNTRAPMVSSIVDAGKEEVFDFTLRDDTHWGVVKTDGEVGVIAHNCAEISLHSNQFCNLSTINLTNIKDKKDYLKRVKAATIIGTLQASYTDFPYLRPIWSEVTAREALLGVSSTGIADSQGVVTSEWLKEGAKLVLETNEQFAKKLGINVSARSTALKPEGTASCILGSSSGIHARHSKYYLRRVRMNKDDSLAKYLKLVMPTLVEDDVFSPSGVVVTIPQKSPDNAITRDDETAIDLFNRVVNYYSNWVVPGHRTGQNTHNVSVTISYKPEDVELLKERLWEDRDKYAAVSLLPFDGSVYQQAPFEACTEDTFTEYYAQVKEVDLKQVVEVEDTTERLQQLACSGGVCEIT